MARIVISNKDTDVEVHIRMESYKDQGWVALQLYVDESMVASIEVKNMGALRGYFNDPEPGRKKGYISISEIGKGRMIFLDYRTREQLEVKLRGY